MTVSTTIGHSQQLRQETNKVSYKVRVYSAPRQAAICQFIETGITPGPDQILDTTYILGETLTSTGEAIPLQFQNIAVWTDITTYCTGISINESIDSNEPVATLSGSKYNSIKFNQNYAIYMTISLYPHYTGDDPLEVQIQSGQTLGSTGSLTWSSYRSFYFGWLVSNNITVDAKLNTWRATLRSELYRFEAYSPGTHVVGPDNIARGKQVKVSSTLADPSDEAASGEFVGLPSLDGSHLVDGDPSTLWFSSEPVFNTNFNNFYCYFGGAPGPSDSNIKCNDPDGPMGSRYNHPGIPGNPPGTVDSKSDRWLQGSLNILTQVCPRGPVWVDPILSQWFCVWTAFAEVEGGIVHSGFHVWFHNAGRGFALEDIGCPTNLASNSYIYVCYDATTFKRLHTIPDNAIILEWGAKYPDLHLDPDFDALRITGQSQYVDFDIDNLKKPDGTSFYDGTTTDDQQRIDNPDGSTTLVTVQGQAPSRIRSYQICYWGDPNQTQGSPSSPRKRKLGWKRGSPGGSAYGPSDFGTATDWEPQDAYLYAFGLDPVTTPTNRGRLTDLGYSTLGEDGVPLNGGRVIYDRTGGPVYGPANNAFKQYEWVEENGVDVNGFGLFNVQANPLPPIPPGWVYHTTFSKDDPRPFLGVIPHGPTWWVALPQPLFNHNRGINHEWASIDLGKDIDVQLDQDLSASYTGTINIVGQTDQLPTTEFFAVIDGEVVRLNTAAGNTINVSERAVDHTTAQTHNKGAELDEYDLTNHAIINNPLVWMIRIHRAVGPTKPLPTEFSVFFSQRPAPIYPPGKDNPSSAQYWSNTWEYFHGYTASDFHNGDFVIAFSDPKQANGPKRIRHILVQVLAVQTINNIPQRLRINEIEVYRAPQDTTDPNSHERISTTLDVVNHLIFQHYNKSGFDNYIHPNMVIIPEDSRTIYINSLTLANENLKQVLSSMADRTGYRFWFDRWSRLHFARHPIMQSPGNFPPVSYEWSRKSSMRLDPQQPAPSAISQVVLEAVNVDRTTKRAGKPQRIQFPPMPVGNGNPRVYRDMMIGDDSDAYNMARLTFFQLNSGWKATIQTWLGEWIQAGQRHLITWPYDTGDSTNFNETNFYVTNVRFDIILGPQGTWKTQLDLDQYKAIDVGITDPNNPSWISVR